MAKIIPDCKRFNGYKPCYPDHNCWEDGCKDKTEAGIKILIINLDAMGDVLMTTAQLPALKRKYPVSTITWVTLKIAAPLLQNNQYIDRIYSYDFESISILQQLEFDVAMNVDKSQRSGSLLNLVNAEKKLGFGMNKNGKIIPMNEGAYYNYNLGMDDNLKFRLNTVTGQEYLSETFEVDYSRDEYTFNFTPEELNFIELYKAENHLSKNDLIVGFNTGCSTLFPNKKMSIEQHVYLIEKMLNAGRYKILLLGGPEDEERNNLIHSHFKDRIINTPTNLGVRKGACFESIPDVIITGDSFGMHLAIALKKYVIAWFGVSCWSEIDLYDRGIKLYPSDLACSPCWKKECPYNLECINSIDLNRILEEVDTFFTSKNTGRIYEFSK